MKGKTILFSLLTFALGTIGFLAPTLSLAWQAWLGVLALAITMFLQVVMPTGTLPTGWTVAMWGINIGGILVLIVGYLGDNALIPPSVATIIVSLMNLFIVTFLKDYGAGSRLIPNKSA